MNTKNTIIFGGPGCGKTHYLLNLLDDLLKTYKPNEIAFVSFTRKGAYEGRERAMDRFNYPAEMFPFFRTLHSICYQSAGVTRNRVMMKRHYKDFSNASGFNLVGYYTDDGISGDDKLMFYYFLLRNNPKLAESCDVDINIDVFDKFSTEYDNYKKEKRMLDFTDMLLRFRDKNEALPVKIAIIDEAQDLTTLQWQVCDIAFRNCDHVYIAGDDDQAIYEWNGADVNTFLSLAGERVILDKSNRMPSTILKFTNNISNLIQNRVVKQFGPREEGGLVAMYGSFEEVDLSIDGSYYLLSRNNVYLKKYADVLRERGLQYTDLSGGNPSMSKRLLRAIRAHEGLRSGAAVNDVDRLIALQYIRSDCDKTKPWYEIFNLDEEDVEYYRTLIENGNADSSSAFTLSSFHGVKGGEADNVVVLLDYTRRTARNYTEHEDAELRCLYVGCTRAKKTLHIVGNTAGKGYDDNIDMSMCLTSCIPQQKRITRSYIDDRDIKELD